ncbi:hypothetical protein SUB233_01604 [Streptococcus uberis]
MMKSPKIINLVNCYNNEKEVINYAKHINKLVNSNYLILAININSLNSLDEVSFTDSVKKEFKNSIVINSQQNFGYLNGMLNAYQSIEKNIDISELKYIIMSNTDIIFENNNFLFDLLNCEYNERIGCIAPSVFMPDRKTYENPQQLLRYSLSDINRRIWIFSHPMISFLYFKLSDIKSKVIKRKKKKSCEVYSAHGCFFILSKDFFNKIKDKKYGSLMYSEEAYIAEMIKKYNYTAFYDSNLEVMHLESTVTSLLDNKSKSKMYVDSLNYIKSTFYGDEI